MFVRSLMSSVRTSPIQDVCMRRVSPLFADPRRLADIVLVEDGTKV